MRLHFYGADVKATAGQNLGWAASSKADSTARFRNGLAGTEVVTLVSATAQTYRLTALAAGAVGPLFCRFYLNVQTRPSAENRIFCFGSGATVRCYMTLDSGGLLRIYSSGGALIGSASSALSLDTWYRIECEAKRVSANNDTFKARIDGTQFAGSTTTTIGGNLSSVIFGGNLNSEAQTTGHWYFDDIAVNDSTGTYNTTYPGAGSIVVYTPSATGDNTQWGGTTGTWADVDEIPLLSNDYVSSNTTSQISDFAIALYTGTTGVMSSEAVINAVAVSLQAAGEGASANASFVMRIKATSGGTVEESITLTPNLIFPNYRYDGFIGGGSGQCLPLMILEDLPGASTSPWTKALLATAQVGCRCTASSTNASRISGIWVTVDYANTYILTADVGAFTETGVAAKFAIGRLGDCSISGTATSSAAGHINFKGAASISGTAGTSASATVISANVFFGEVAVSGDSLASTSGSILSYASASVTAQAQADLTGLKNSRATASISGSAIDFSEAIAVVFDSASISGTAATSGLCLRIFTDSVLISGTATNSASSTKIVKDSASVSGSAETSATSAAIFADMVSASGTALASAEEGENLLFGGVDITGGADATTNGNIILYARLTVSGRADAVLAAIKKSRATASISGRAITSSAATAAAIFSDSASITGSASAHGRLKRLLTEPAVSITATATSSAASRKKLRAFALATATANVADLSLIRKRLAAAGIAGASSAIALGLRSSLPSVFISGEAEISATVKIPVRKQYIDPGISFTAS